MITGERTTREREKAHDSSKEKVVRIAQNPDGFHAVDALPKGENFNAAYCTEHILQPILEYRSKSGLCQFIIHQDNVRSHMARKSRTLGESNSFRIGLHSPYSPDLDPSNFFFLGFSSTA
jgi:hypothetical protein